MIGLLRAILNAVERLLAGQSEAERQASADKVSLDAQLAELSAAVEHLRVLVEGDTLIAAVGAPTFTPTGGSTQ
jgi:hypothetical protein